MVFYTKYLWKSILLVGNKFQISVDHGTLKPEVIVIACSAITDLAYFSPLTDSGVNYSCLFIAAEGNISNGCV